MKNGGNQGGKLEKNSSKVNKKIGIVILMSQHFMVDSAMQRNGAATTTAYITFSLLLLRPPPYIISILPRILKRIKGSEIQKFTLVMRKPPKVMAYFRYI